MTIYKDRLPPEVFTHLEKKLLSLGADITTLSWRKSHEPDDNEVQTLDSIRESLQMAIDFLEEFTGEQQ
jgi:hypothetical protein